MRIVLMAALAVATWAAPCAQAEEDGPQVPEGARIRLEPEKTAWRLGENIIVRYVVENISDEPFVIRWGGDNRAIRAIRNVVDVYAADGQLVPDPFPNPPCFGGPGGSFQVTMSRPLVIEIPILRYRLLAKPGHYKVRVLHDLGWGGKGASQHGDHEAAFPAPDDPRWAETTIDLFEPPPDQIDEILDAMTKLDKPGNRTALKRNRAWSDFGMIRHPAYLPALVKRARDRGALEPHWLKGIRSIETREATEALIDLLEAEGREDLAEGVVERLPVPEHIPQLIDFVQGFGVPKQTAERMRGAWDSALASRVRAVARRCLSGGPLTRWAPHAAYMLSSVGTPEDLPALTEGLESALDLSRAKAETHANPKHRTRLQQCYQAAVHLYRRGAVPPAKPKRPEEIALAALWLAEHGNDGVERYGASVAVWLQQGDLAIRDLLLRCLPRPLPEVVIPQLGALLEAEDLQLRISALYAIRDAKATRFRSLVAAQLAAADDFMWIAAADGAAEAIGLTWTDRLRLHVTAFDGETGFRNHWQYAARVFLADGHSSSGIPDETGRRELKERWLAFIEAHEKALNDGKRFARDDPAVSGLVPSTVDMRSPRR